VQPRQTLSSRGLRKLRPHGPGGHEARLVEGPPLFAKNHKPMTVQEPEAVKRHLDGQLFPGLEEESKSVSTIQALNEITIKDRYPIPLLNETPDRLSKAKVFSKFDVVHPFNRIRMRGGHKWL
jgi:hypothetical protein